MLLFDDSQSELHSAIRILFPHYHLSALVVTLPNFLQIKSKSSQKNGEDVSIRFYMTKTCMGFFIHLNTTLLIQQDLFSNPKKYV